MPSQLHKDVAAVAATSGAIVISELFLSQLVVDRLQAAARQLNGALFPTAFDGIAGVFDGLSIDPSEVHAQLVGADDAVTLTISPDFNFRVRLVWAADHTKTFSQVIYSAKSLAIQLQGSGTSLSFVPTASGATLDRSTLPQVDRDDALAATSGKVTAEDVLRAEGAAFFGANSNILAQALSKFADIDFTAMFPSISMSAPLRLHVVKDALVVVPQSLSILSITKCGNKNPVAGIKLKQEGAKQSGSDFSYGIRADIPTPAAYRANQKLPTAALYAPMSILDARFTGGLLPALAFNDFGTGFIGHRLEITASVTAIKVVIEDLTLKLKLAFKLTGHATLDIDVPCVGRVDWGRLDIDLPETGEADIEVLLRGALDSSARIDLLTEVIGINLGKAKASLSLFGPAIRFLTGDWGGYVADFLIGKIIQNNVPGMLFDKLKEELEHRYFTVVDLKHYLSFFANNQVPNQSMVSGIVDQSALVGLNYSD